MCGVPQHDDAGRPGCDDVRPAVAVQVAHSDRGRSAAGREAHSGLESSVALAQVHRDLAGYIIAHRQIELAVQVEVCNRNTAWTLAGRVRTARLEGAIAIPGQHRDVVRS